MIESSKTKNRATSLFSKSKLLSDVQYRTELQKMWAVDQLAFCISLHCISPSFVTIQVKLQYMKLKETTGLSLSAFCMAYWACFPLSSSPPLASVDTFPIRECKSWMNQFPIPTWDDACTIACSRTLCSIMLFTLHQLTQMLYTHHHGATRQQKKAAKNERLRPTFYLSSLVCYVIFNQIITKYERWRVTVAKNQLQRTSVGDFYTIHLRSTNRLKVASTFASLKFTSTVARPLHRFCIHVVAR